MFDVFVAIGFYAIGKFIEKHNLQSSIIKWKEQAHTVQ